MTMGILGRKVGMTRLFDEKGQVQAVTAVEAGPCIVTQVKTAAKEGYDAVQLGFGAVRRLNSPEQGHLKKLGSFRYLREFRLAKPAELELGQKVGAGLFAVGEKVKVIGVSKGKGFQGGVKRHHFRGGPKTHGQSDRWRGPGAIGSTTTPGRVLKGLRMAGHMGNERVSTRNVKVVQADAEKNLILLAGSVPGPTGALVLIQKAKGES